MRISIAQIIVLSAFIVSLVIAGFAFFFSPPEVPIWYSLSIPEQQLDQKTMLFLFPSSIAVMTIAHFFLNKKLRQIDAQLALIFSYATLIPISIILVAQLRIVILTI